MGVPSVLLDLPALRSRISWPAGCWAHSLCTSTKAAQLHVCLTSLCWKTRRFRADTSCGWHRYIWGRGTIDMKGSLVALLEALLHLHRAGYAPQRTLLLVVGHDEEVGGPHGAGAVGKMLAQRGTRVAVVLDEGTSVLSDGLGSLVQKPVAVVGTAEKVRKSRALFIPLLAACCHIHRLASAA
jgi:Peptidase family M20/M25/M40